MFMKPLYVLAVFLVLTACTAFVWPSEAGVPEGRRLILATTTSVADSGLLKALLPPFTRTRGIRVDVVAVGTGQALTMARRGDADAVIVHAPALEQEFMDDGYGVMRTCIAYNKFAIVGPRDDPAQVRRATSAVDAFTRIAGRRAPFISRGDGSGTEAKEKEIWTRSGLEPRGEGWYVASGAGMGMTLTMAHEKQAYALTDIATYLKMERRLRLALLYDRDPSLINQYAAIATNPSKLPRVNFDDAAALITYLRSSEALSIIASFGRGQFSRPLFIPLRGRCLL
jgi:tungstate transport system substrate-binding protein